MLMVVVVVVVIGDLSRVVDLLPQQA